MKNLERLDENLVLFGEKISYEYVISDWVGKEYVRWSDFAKKRGYLSVREWRESYLIDFGLMDQGEWYEAEVLDNEEFVKNVYMGPYNGWGDFYQNDRDKSKLVGNLDRPRSIAEKSSIRENAKVQEFLKNFHEEITLIVAYDGLRFCLIDGHHRTAALAVMLDEDMDISRIKVNLKLLDLRGKQEVFDKFFYFER